MPSDATPRDEDEDKKTTWTAEEIREWEEENDGICPAFDVNHRPERQPVSNRGCLWDDCEVEEEETVVVNVYSATDEHEKSRVCEDHLNALRSRSGISVEVDDSDLRADGGRPEHEE